MYLINMSSLNYHHLFNFWNVAREGSIARACDRLLLTQPTISVQIRELELSLGVKLFDRVGRNLVLTEAGHEAYGYADEIFALGRKLKESMQGNPIGQATRLTIGIHQAMPKLISCRILAFALSLPQPIQIVCQEGPIEQHLERLAQYELDGILSNSPVPPNVKVRAFNHLLGECGVTFCATPKLAARCRRKFPYSLNGAPFLLPLPDNAQRRALEHWLEETGIRVNVCGEFADSALLNAFGRIGTGIFVVPTVIEKDVCRQFCVKVLGRVPAVRERFYLIAVERKLRQSAVSTVAKMAREKIFV